jgi:hypothetical protein
MNVTDPVYFATEYLGYNMPKHQREWLSLGVESINKKTNLLFLGPADHGKSFTFSHILPLYLITMDRRLRIILTSGSDEGPLNIGSAIQHHLNYNEKLIDDFGSFRRKGRWNKKELKVLGANPNEKDPSFFFCGIGSEMKYHRADIIICDDMVTLKNSQTDKWRDKIERFFFEILMNTLEPWGVCLINGTREHKYDLYSKIEKNSEFNTVIANPIVNEEKGLSLWPEMWPVERLKKRKNLDFTGYQKRFCNIIADDDGQKDASRNIEAAKDRDKSFVSSLSAEERDSYDRVYMSLDPNLSKKAKASRTVLMTMGFKGQDRYLLNMQRRTFAVWEYKLMVEMVKKEVEYFAPDELFVESNSFGGLLTEQIREAKVSTKVTSLWTGGQKKHLHLGIPGLYPILTNGQLHCPYKDMHSQALSDIFLNEILNWPNVTYQDCVMAWYFIEKGTRKPKIKPESVRTVYTSSLSRFGRFKTRRR